MLGEKNLPTLDEYPHWLKEQTGVDLDSPYERNYETNAAAALSTWQAHPFFQRLEPTLSAIEAEYLQRTGSRLFSSAMNAARVDFETKTFKAAIDKSYRHNVIQNDRFPREPKGGWLLPETWIQRMNDIVRGTTVCRYIDGPQFVAERLADSARRSGLPVEVRSLQQDYGYYAYHMYVTIPVELTRLDWSKSEYHMMVEIQLTTQLQDLVRELTHRAYEEFRVIERKRQVDQEWKWSFKSERFKGSYLSHTLHLIEGIIAELRDEAHAAREEPKERNADATTEAADAASAAPSNDPSASASG